MSWKGKPYHSWLMPKLRCNFRCNCKILPCGLNLLSIVFCLRLFFFDLWKLILKMFYQLTVSNISRMNLPDNFSTYFGYNCCLWAWCTTLAFDVIISSLKREFQALFEDIAFIVLKGDSLLAATSNYPWNLVCLNQYVYIGLNGFCSLARQWMSSTLISATW